MADNLPKNTLHKMAPLSLEDIKNIHTKLKGRSIIFIGLMGCGKSTIGHKTAKLLNMDFFDSDYEIEKNMQTSIAEIFKRNGEAYFRKLEQETIETLLEKKNSLIALGGGAFIQKTIRENILQNHLAIWLKADLYTTMKRVQMQNNRPLLNVQDPKSVLKNLIKQRYPIYQHAHIHLKNTTKKRQAIAKTLIEKIKFYLEQENIHKNIK